MDVESHETANNGYSAGGVPDEYNALSRTDSILTQRTEPGSRSSYLDHTEYNNLNRHGHSALHVVRSYRKPLASMFEEFLEQHDHRNDGAAAKLGLILFGESSPLTFALEEVNRGVAPRLHDADSDLSKNQRHVERPRGSQVSHCSAEDISYLDSKRVFVAPELPVLDRLVAAYLENFHPLYSIVDRAELEQSHQAQNLPWILLHAICFIGATYCDSSVIYKSNFKSRLDARRSFYDKAKILFDVGYETDKFILLQTVIMLSFWGPQMKSYWNPCSWIGFGVTIAESLGIHRSNSLAPTNPKGKSLVRRLFWSLAVRDAYCAALLGRPFRINLEQCDTAMLDLHDFELEDGQGDQALYQIQVAQLSLILRKIIERLFKPTCQFADVADLQDMLDHWQAQIPLVLQWSTYSGPSSNAFITSLRLLYQYHRLLIHLERPSNAIEVVTGLSYSDPTSVAIAESAAQMISSSAAMLVTKQLTKQLPHEVFAGFFVAGIVLYRRMREGDPLKAQMARASLDNCQMLLNEVRDSWDPAYWILRIFDFLVSNLSSNGGSEEEPGQADLGEVGANLGGADNMPTHSEPMLSDWGGMQHSSNVLHSVDWESPDHDPTGNFDDLLCMPNFFMPSLS